MIDDIESGVFATRRGRVYLVGAGPGDPELLTVRAHRLLTTASVVAYDELVGSEVLGLIPRSAERFSVGRRKGTSPSAPAIHPVVVDRAMQGHDVVRLKGGDPFVFGRGGEEAERLTALKIPFEVVPGISAALGAAASSGIPLTHREVAHGVMLLTAHLRDEGVGDIGPRVPSETTLVFYMGLSTLRDTARSLVSAGRLPTTPAAVIAHATLPTQRVLVATLETIADAVEAAAVSAPALVIIGDVVSRRVVSVEDTAGCDKAIAGVAAE